MARRRGATRRSSAEWRKIIAAWRRSGLSQVEFCRREDLVVATFRWHRYELGHRKKTGPGRGDLSFVELNAPAPDTAAKLAMGGATASGVEVMVGPDRRVRVERGFDHETLRDVVHVLEGRPLC